MAISPYNKALKQTGQWIVEQPGLEKQFGYFNIHSALIKSNGDRDAALKDLELRFNPNSLKE